jgi:hypothetical protein
MKGAFIIMPDTDKLDLPNIHHFDNESKHKIGAITYIVTAYFDENRDNLKTKITNLLRNEVGKNIHSQTGLSQSSGI